MTKVIKERKVSYEEDYCDHIICDICKVKSNGSDWGSSVNSDDEITISRVRGYSDRDGGLHTAVSFDLCPSCFMNKLIPWLKENGGEPSEEEYF